jgi:hypothetical protein
MIKACAGLLLFILVLSGCSHLKYFPKKITIGSVEKKAKKQRISRPKTSLIQLKGYQVAYLHYPAIKYQVKEQCGYRYFINSENSVTEFIMPHIRNDSLKIDTLHFEVLHQENKQMKTWFTYGPLHNGIANFISARTIHLGKINETIEKYCLAVPYTDQFTKKTRFEYVTIFHSGSYGVIKVKNIPYQFTVSQPGTKTGKTIRNIIHAITRDKEFSKGCEVQEGAK